MTKVDTQDNKIHKNAIDGMIKHGDTLAQAESIVNRAPLTDQYKENYDKINWKEDEMDKGKAT